MGIIPGEDYEVGGACLHCWNAAFAAAFGPGFLHTPKYVQVTFSDVIACVPGGTPNGSWLLTQTIDPCLWSFENAIWNMSYYARFFADPEWLAHLSALHKPTPGRAFAADSSECALTFSNALGPGACVGGEAGHSGSGLVTWGPGIAP